jgi:hypothetical protein
MLLHVVAKSSDNISPVLTLPGRREELRISGIRYQTGGISPEVIEPTRGLFQQHPCGDRRSVVGHTLGFGRRLAMQGYGPRQSGCQQQEYGWFSHDDSIINKVLLSVSAAKIVICAGKNKKIHFISELIRFRNM